MTKEPYLIVLEVILAALLDKVPNVETIRDDRGILLLISGIPKDSMPLIIGREGSHINAIRYVVKLAAIQSNARVAIKIQEPNE